MKVEVFLEAKKNYQNLNSTKKINLILILCFPWSISSCKKFRVDDFVSADHVIEDIMIASTMPATDSACNKIVVVLRVHPVECNGKNISKI